MAVLSHLEISKSNLKIQPSELQGRWVQYSQSDYYPSDKNPALFIQKQTCLSHVILVLKQLFSLSLKDYIELQKECQKRMKMRYIQMSQLCHF